MEEDLVSHQATLHLLPYYGAHPDFVAGVGWRLGKNGHVLFDKKSKIAAVSTVVGRVLEYKLNCGPSGNYINSEYGSLQTAKYELHLEKPTETLFASDFDTVLKNLMSLQDLVAGTDDRRNLIVKEGEDFHLRFATKVFEKRVCDMYRR